MKRLGSRTQQEALDYHLRRDDAPEFDVQQPGRVDLARFLIDKILRKDLQRRPLKFIELGCGAGDVTGPYASPQIEVHGYDVVPVAQEKCASRFPQMVFHLGPVEEVEPQECDLLVMTEFLEHVIDPISIVSAWLPLAKWSIIGHPLDEPEPPYEFGHNWSYSLDDWRAWFALGNHRYFERLLFEMGSWENMVLGHSARLDQPAWQGIHPDT